MLLPKWIKQIIDANSTKHSINYKQIGIEIVRKSSYNSKEA